MEKEAYSTKYENRKSMFSGPEKLMITTVIVGVGLTLYTSFEKSAQTYSENRERAIANRELENSLISCEEGETEKVEVKFPLVQKRSMRFLGTDNVYIEPNDNGIAINFEDVDFPIELPSEVSTTTNQLNIPNDVPFSFEDNGIAYDMEASVGTSGEQIVRIGARCILSQ